MSTSLKYLIVALSALASSEHAWAEKKDRHGHVYEEIYSQSSPGVYELKIKIVGVESTAEEFQGLSEVWDQSAKSLCKRRYSGKPEPMAFELSTHWISGDNISGTTNLMLEGVHGTVICSAKTTSLRSAR